MWTRHGSGVPCCFRCGLCSRGHFSRPWKRSSGPREPVDPREVGDYLFRLEAGDEGVLLSRHLEVKARIDEFREFVVHRSLYQLKESDPIVGVLRRLGFDPEATDFYDEHVEADAVHENIAAYDLAGGLARQEPALAGDIIFGARALLYLEDRLGRHLLAAWGEGE